LFESLFTPVEIVHVVEVEKGTRLPELTGDLKESLKALQHSPAWNYMVARLRHQGAALNNTLKEGLQLTETQLRFLQAGLYWISFIEKDFAKLTQTVPQARPATDPEADQFRNIQQNVELIGA
jgi:hypothetical protein